MSWLAASLLVLGLALVAGFAWYERSHPTARVLALVATLAALAALGRIAFAPLPNVKPTTDIVLLTGYALGGAPGFAVGAVAALASNVFFGQGPWTPWQMCAWGGVGVAGALLARVAGRELGRVGLAVACAVAGAAYGVVMNLHLWVTYSGDHSLAQLGAYFATSLPFDLAHVVGNVLFCLLFGPALVRALTRFRQRFEVSWRPAPVLAATLARRAADGRRRAARRPGGHAASMAGERAEPRRRLRRRPRPALDRHLHELGRARARRRRAQPARRGEPRRLRPLPSALAPRRPRRHHPHDHAAARRRPVAADRRARPRRRTAGPPPRQRLVRRPREHERVRDLRPRRHERPRRPRRRALHRAPGERGRRLQLRHQGCRLRHRRHRRRRDGARRRRPPRHADGPPRRALPRPPPEPRRRLPAAARRRLQRAVDRVGGPGPRRRRPRPGPPAPGRREVPARLPALADHPEREGPLLADERQQTPVWVTGQALAALARKPFPLAPVPRAKRAAPAPTPAPAPKATPAPKRKAKAAAPKVPSEEEGWTSYAPLSGGTVGPPTPADLEPKLQAAAHAAAT